ncbi:MAG: hypothetical protein ACFFFG_02200 [Candidatus Thorarchaeota archaeon]
MSFSGGEIRGINKELLKNDDITLAWKIIGEASEWVLSILNVYEDDHNIPRHQIAQVLHFFPNLLQMPIQ